MLNFINMKTNFFFLIKSVKQILVILISFILWSCGTNPEKTKTTITIVGENSSNMYAFQAAANDYISNSQDSLVFKPVDYDDTLESIENNFSLQNGLHDIVFLYNFTFPETINPDIVYDFDSLIKNESTEKLAFKEDIFPNTWDEAGSFYHSVNGKENKATRINYPVAMNTMVLIYNKEMFANDNNKKRYEQKYHKPLEVPTNWHDYYNVAAFFTNPTDKTYGVTIQGKADGYLYYEYCDYLFGMGGKVFDKNSGWQGNVNTPIIIDNEAGLKATTYYKSLKPFNNGDFINVDGAQQRKYMQEGKTAMALVWSDYLRFYAYNESGVLDDRFGYTTLPGTASPLQGAYLWLNKKSPNPNNAAQYILYCLQKPNQIKLVKQGLCSPQASVYESPELSNIPYLKALKSSLQRGGYVFEYGPEVNVVSQAITNNMQKMWLDEITPKQALEKIKQEIALKRVACYR